jgi:dienelactone hydrolase
VKIEVTPSVGLFDDVVTINVTGANPGSPVTVTARMTDIEGTEWSSRAVFTADASGAVDVSKQAPTQGTYDGVEPMGLFWSMAVPEGQSPTLDALVKEKPDPATVTFEASSDGAIATATAERLLQGPGVTREEVRDDGLVGTFFRPASEAKGALIVMTGSDGGLKEDKAALLASRGFAALALGFFGLPGLPQFLNNVPLEYFETAINWLHNQGYDRIGVTGISRGGELTLLLGATFPQISAVAAYSPSSHIYPGFTAESVGDVDSWTYQGQAFAYAPFDMAAVDMADQPIDQSPAFAKTLADPAGAEAGAIKVENTKGPVLLVSGADDKQWQASDFSELAYQRLEKHGHPYPVEHLRYEGAGHMIRYPYVPATVLHYRHPVVPLDFALGGNMRDNARAVEDSWRRLLTFFEESL